MLKFLGVVFLVILGFLGGYVTAIYGVHQDIKGDQKIITKWIKNHGEKQTVLNNYVCMNCDWKKEKTKRILDGTSCPNCKGNTVIPR